MVMTLPVLRPEDHGGGKEQGRRDENDPGDDHYPRRGRVKPRRLLPWRWRWRRGRGFGGGDGRRRGWGFWGGGGGGGGGGFGGGGCFAHHLNIAQPSRDRKGLRPKNSYESASGAVCLAA